MQKAPKPGAPSPPTFEPVRLGHSHRFSRYPSATIGIGESATAGDTRPAMALEESNGTVSVDPAHYREAMAHFATGVAVVTSRDLEGERHGMTANAVTSVS